MDLDGPALLGIGTCRVRGAVHPDHPAHAFFTRRSTILAVMDGLQTQWLLTRDFAVARRFAVALRALGLDPG